MTLIKEFLKVWKHICFCFPIFCAGILLSIYFGVHDEMRTLILGWNGMFVYFVVDTLLVLYDWNLQYIVHHLMCFCLLMLRYGWNDDTYWYVYVPIALSMELSTFFLNLRSVFDKGSYLGILNDIMFVLVWFISRIYFALPKIWHSLLVNNADGGYPIPVYSAVTALTVLHAYWGYLILKKFAKVFAEVLSEKDSKSK